MTFLLAILINAPSVHAIPSTCYDPDRLANTKAALIYFFSRMNTHACKKVASSDIYLSHSVDKQSNNKEYIDFFIKCDQEYPVMGKIQWFEPTCTSAAVPAEFSSAELVK